MPRRLATSAGIPASYKLVCSRWPELAQLPGIGETLAKRIVEVRTTGGPFRDHEEVRLRVRGIGPKTLQQIKPYLAPIAEDAMVAGK